MHPQNRGVSAAKSGTGSATSATAVHSTAASANITVVMTMASCARPKRPTATMLSAKNRDDTSVTTSPNPRPKPRSLESARKPTPVRHRSAATTLLAPGRLRRNAQFKNGTITQYVAVRNALRPGVVPARPTFWMMNAMASGRPITTPASTWLASR